MPSTPALFSSRFGEDPWRLVVIGANPATCGEEETVFALSNGSLGIRGSWEQGAPLHEPGTLVNGFHETWRIEYPEAAYGFATCGQTIVYVPDATGLRVSVDGEILDLADATVTRTLDLRRGVLEATANWDSVKVRWERLVSLTHQSLAAARIEVTAFRPLQLAIDSTWRNRQDTDYLASPEAEFDPRHAPSFTHPVLAEKEFERSPDLLEFSVSYRTVSAGMELSGRCWHHPGSDWEVDIHDAHTRFARQLAAGETATLEKVWGFKIGRESPPPARFAELAQSQIDHLDDFWSRFAIDLPADPALQQSLNWIVFQLHSAATRVDGAGLAAKGLTGQAYEGHYFWDMDVFMLPFVIHTDPEAAARLLRFRHSMLAPARRRAQQLRLNGALFPWRTINGEEASAYFEAGTAQYHINAAVIYGLACYLDATADTELLWEGGLEVAIETARLWADLGFYGEDGAFHIHMVTGPDEYSVLVDDNAYTNLMARFSLRRTISWVEQAASEQPARFRPLADAIDFDEEELDEWRRAADAMYVPFDPERGVTPQDARFLAREGWDWSLPPDRYPLLLHFHPLVIYRHQVLKQADVVMAILNLPKDFSAQLSAANFAYYDPITTGDSSLSPPVQAAVAAMVGETETADHYFRHAALIDLGGLAGNVADGVHLAAAGGVWLALLRGFVGLRLEGGTVTLNPRLPESWEGLGMAVLVRGSLLRIRVTTTTVTVSAEDGGDLPVRIWDQEVVAGPAPITVNRETEDGRRKTEDPPPPSAPSEEESSRFNG
ncbi:MAG TPA: glycosyl hydrolase family 65 protein [Acidimicrobiia bacterium]|nr:glycosyl hydrolase family 65 protein [Acidimicrobiia bacterium]